MDVQKASFGSLKDGREAACFDLVNSNSVRVKLSNYGATIMSIYVPDRFGCLGDVVLGFDNIRAYEADTLYFGSLIGRYANRISQGKVEIDGTSYQLTQNEGDTHLHGGAKGFGKRLWSVDEPAPSDPHAPLLMHYESADGEEGYPGRLSCEIDFFLSDQNVFEINYRCTTDKPTIVSLVHHPYFNLKDGGLSRIYGHEVLINADHYTPLQSDHLPTGEILSVGGTYFDFKKFVSLRARLEHKPVQHDSGYNVNYILNSEKDLNCSAASLYDPDSGRFLEIFTSYPALQFYSGGYLSQKEVGQNISVFKNEHGLCLEPQNFPDASNHHSFSPAVLRPGEVYHHRTCYKFSTPQNRGHRI